MATEFCQKCKQSHPGRPCDYDEPGKCEETRDVDETAEAPGKEPSGKTKTDQTVPKTGRLLI